MEHFWPFILFSVASAVTPGPNNIMLMSSSLNFGVRKTLAHFSGIAFGFPTFVLLIGLGLGEVFALSTTLHLTVKYLGSAYMLYLAYKIATSHKKINQKQQTKPINFIQAFCFQWINPKAWVFATSAISAYTTVSGNIHRQIIVMAFSQFFVLLCCSSIWLVFGYKLKDYLKAERQRAIFNYIMGGLLTLAVVMIFVE